MMELKSANLVLIEMMEKFKIPSKSISGNYLPPIKEPIISRRPRINIDIGTIEVDTGDLNLWVNPKTGFFEINGNYGVVYLHTTYSSDYDVEKLPKWHVAMCRTLMQRLREGNLHDRYALKQSKFIENEFTLSLANSYSDIKIKRKLRACKNCLDIINQKIGGGYRDSSKYCFVDFVNEFKNRNPFNLNSSGFTSSPIPNIYNPDFKEKANNYKRNKPYCEDCKEKYMPKFLEVHHKNRKKYDDDLSNWKVLCVSCHIYEHRGDNPRMRLMYESNGRLEEFYRMYPKKSHDPIK